MSYQQIETIIENLKTNPSFPNIKKLTKYFSQYTNLEQSLPPENLMVFAIFKLPSLWHRILKLKEAQPLYDEPTLALSLYLKLYLNTLIKLLNQSPEEEVQHIVLQGMVKSVNLTLPYRKIYRAWVKSAMDIWTSGPLNIKIRAFTLLNLFLQNFQQEERTWLLRRCYLKFMENCKQVSWRSFESINLMINSFCELCRVCPDIAYFVAFGNLRLIIMQIDKTNKESKHKRKELIKKLYSFQILNCLKLLSSIITRVDHPSISPLIYPLVQTLQVYSKLDLSTQYLPLRLHVLGFLQEVSEKTGTFIPYLIELSTRQLQCKQFLKFKPKSTEKVESDLALIYQISPATYKLTQFWSEAFDEIVKKIYYTCNLCLRFSSAPEILGQIVKVLSKEYKQVKFAGYKIKLKALIKNLKQDMGILVEKRHLRQKVPVQYPLTKLKNLGLSIVDQHEKNVKSDLLLLKQKLAAEFQDVVADENAEQQDQKEYQGDQQGDYQGDGEQQGDQGFEEDNSGASSYQPSEKQKSSDGEEEREDVSYEGDPENADELIQQWSEHEWSSQDEL